MGLSGLCHQCSLYLVAHNRPLLRISRGRAESKGCPTRTLNRKITHAAKRIPCHNVLDQLLLQWTGREPHRAQCIAPSKSGRFCTLLMGWMQWGKARLLLAGSHLLHPAWDQKSRARPCCGKSARHILAGVRLFKSKTTHRKSQKVCWREMLGWRPPFLPIHAGGKGGRGLEHADRGGLRAGPWGARGGTRVRSAPLRKPCC